LTEKLFAPPMLTFWLIVTLKPLAKTVSPLLGMEEVPFQVALDDQLPDATAHLVAMIRYFLLSCNLTANYEWIQPSLLLVILQLEMQCSQTQWHPYSAIHLPWLG
jgi:hypothetical protein